MTDTFSGLTGANRIGGSDLPGTGRTVHSCDPATGETHPLGYRDADPAQIDLALRTAAAASDGLREDRFRRAAMLRGVADALVDETDALVALARVETGLPQARLEGEVSRAATQFRAFADVVERGTYLEVHIDGPGSSTDIRRTLRPVGPVAVFGASNFPFAFSVAGGDTASALAAGCPVVVKAHPAHPGTSERSARIIGAAISDHGLPPGSFAMLHGAAPEVGRALVEHPLVEAVGFTGSFGGGRALFDAAAARPRPVPVYAEMGSTNPVFVTPAALAARGSALADEVAGSVVLGMGQFCTKPGLVVVPEDAARDFADRMAEAMRATPVHPMLTTGIRESFLRGVEASRAVPGVEVVLDGAPGPTGAVQHPTLVVTDVATFRADEALREERFGPFAVVIGCEPERYEEVAAELPGALVASVYAEPGDHTAFGRLWATLEERAGRLVVNQVPTGVAVVAAMHHGGPYPSSTTPLFTSVGATAIRRFLRPVAYQNAPEQLLPDELRDAPSRPLWRSIDGELTREPVRVGEPG